MKVIEIDGKKYEADDNGKAVVGEDGKPKPYVEPKPTDDDKKSKDDDGEKFDPANAELEELAKVNPKLADFMKQAQDNAKAVDDAKKAADDAERKKLEEKGEWEKLAQTEKDKREKLEADLAKSNELLGKHKTTIKSALDALLKEIPEDKKALIPDSFTERQQFEYIIKNADLLGVKSVVTNKGGGVPQNDDNPQDDEVVMQKRFDELREKKDKSRAEENELLDIAKKLKDIKLKKQSEKK